MEDTLGDKVRTFVDFWIQSHIRAEGYQAEGDTRLAGALARKCVEMAQTDGLSASDIDAEFGDIIEYVHWQIKSAISVRDIDRASITYRSTAGRRVDRLLSGVRSRSVTQPNKSRFEAR